MCIKHFTIESMLLLVQKIPLRFPEVTAERRAATWRKCLLTIGRHIYRGPFEALNHMSYIISDTPEVSCMQDGRMRSRKVILHAGIKLVKTSSVITVQQNFYINFGKEAPSIIGTTALKRQVVHVS